MSSLLNEIRNYSDTLSLKKETFYEAIAGIPLNIAWSMIINIILIYKHRFGFLVYEPWLYLFLAGYPFLISCSGSFKKCMAGYQLKFHVKF